MRLPVQEGNQVRTPGIISGFEFETHRGPTGRNRRLLRTAYMSDQETVIHTLRRVSRRAWATRAIRAVALGILVFLVPLLTAQTHQTFFSRPVPYSGVLMIGWLAVVGLALLWMLVRGGSIGQAAGLADTRASLKDEMKTAYGFISKQESDPWIDLQVHRAAATARELDPRQIVPLNMPRGVLLADGLLLFLAIFLWSSTPVAPLQEEVFSEVDEQVQTIEDLLRSSAEEDESRQALEDLDGVLRRLGADELTMEDVLRELWETENRLAEAGLDTGELQSELEEVAHSLEGVESVRKLAESLEARNLEEAADLLNSLAEEWKKQPPEDLSELGDAMALAETQSKSMDDWLEAMRLAVDALQNDDPESAQQLMQEAAQSLEAMDDFMRSREQLNEASKEMGKLRNSLARQDRGDSELKPPDGESPGLDVEEVPLSALDAEWKDDPGGGPDGYPAGPGESAGEGERPTTLEVHLEREMIESEVDPEIPVPEEFKEKESREEPAEMSYEDIQPRSHYAEADVMSPDEIPWQFRDLIKNYFLTIRGNSEP